MIAAATQEIVQNIHVLNRYIGNKRTILEVKGHKQLKPTFLHNTQVFTISSN